MVVMIVNFSDDGVSGDKKNGDGVDDGGVNINSSDDVNWADSENIFDCGENKVMVVIAFVTVLLILMVVVILILGMTRPKLVVLMI